MTPDLDSKPRSKPTLPKHLQTTLRPSPNRTTSQVSSISVEVSLPDQDTNNTGRALLSKDPKYHRQRPYSQSHIHTPTRSRAITESSTTGTSANTAEDGSPKIQRTLSAPGTPGRATSTSAQQASLASTRSPSTYSLSLQALTGASASPSGSSTPSRKGKEKAVEDVEVDSVEVEGELVVHDGDATKGLRELVKRTTIGEAVPRYAVGGGMQDGSEGMSLSAVKTLDLSLTIIGKDEFHTINPPSGMFPHPDLLGLSDEANYPKSESTLPEDITS